MGPTAVEGSFSLRKRILNYLRAPRFVYKYQLHNSSIRQLERKVVDDVAASKYNWFLSTYNTMLLFEWPKSDIIDRDYYWREFARSVDQKSSSSGDSSTIYFSEKISNRALDTCLNTKLLTADSEHRCLFHNGLEASSLADLVESVNENTGELKLKLMALRVNFEGDKGVNDFVTSLQPVLEESMNMYKDVHYEKLLQLARQTKDDNSVKDVLAKLAENNLSSPRLVRNNSWLLFAHSEHLDHPSDKQAISAII